MTIVVIFGIILAIIGIIGVILLACHISKKDETDSDYALF